MAATLKDRRTNIKAQGTHRHHIAKLAATKALKGTIACKNAAGYLVGASDAAALIVVGIFEETVDNSAGAAGDLEARYVTGVEVELENDGNVGQATLEAYVLDNQTATNAATAVNDVFIGPVTEFTAATAIVIIDEAANIARASAKAYTDAQIAALP
jgi:hypothetical protein